MNQHRGFTLIEMLAALVSFGILSGAIVATMSIANKYWQSGNAGANAKDAARYVLQTISAELSQAVIDPDPATGYQIISPSLSLLPPPQNAPTAVLSPNANPGEQTEPYVIFTEPNSMTASSYYWALAANGTSSAAAYQKIEYQILGSTLFRTQTQYTAKGTTNETDRIFEIEPGTLSMTASYRTPYGVLLTVTAKGSKGPAYSLSSEIFIPGSMGQ